MEIILTLILGNMIFFAVNYKCCILDPVCRTPYNSAVIGIITHIFIKALTSEHDVDNIAVLVRHKKVGNNRPVIYDRSLISAVGLQCKLFCFQIRIAC